MTWRERLAVNPSRMEIELKLLLDKKGVEHRTQVDIPVTCADFMIPRKEGRPLLVFVDGPVHLGAKRADKDERVRSILRENGFPVLELAYLNYSQKALNGFLQEIMEALGRPD